MYNVQCTMSNVHIIYIDTEIAESFSLMSTRVVYWLTQDYPMSLCLLIAGMRRKLE